MNYILNHKYTLIGIAAGAILGYLYYHFYGCQEACAVTSKPTNSTLYGALMGRLILNMFKKEKPKAE